MKIFLIILGLIYFISIICNAYCMWKAPLIDEDEHIIDEKN